MKPLAKKLAIYESAVELQEAFADDICKQFEEQKLFDSVAPNLEQLKAETTDCFENYGPNPWAPTKETETKRTLGKSAHSSSKPNIQAGKSGDGFPFGVDPWMMMQQGIALGLRAATGGSSFLPAGLFQPFQPVNWNGAWPHLPGDGHTGFDPDLVAVKNKRVKHEDYVPCPDDLEADAMSRSQTDGQASFQNFKAPGFPGAFPFGFFPMGPMSPMPHFMCGNNNTAMGSNEKRTVQVMDTNDGYRYQWYHLLYDVVHPFKSCSHLFTAKKLCTDQHCSVI